MISFKPLADRLLIVRVKPPFCPTNRIERLKDE